jgi:hypothetical protein
MAYNPEEVEEKAEDDVDSAIKTSKNTREFERKMDPRDVSYKLKDETKEGEKEPYETNQ